LHNKLLRSGNTNACSDDRGRKSTSFQNAHLELGPFFAGNVVDVFELGHVAIKLLTGASKLCDIVLQQVP